MAQQFGFLSELSGIELAEDGDTFVSTIQAMPYGKYEHPLYGKIDFNEQVAAQAAANVNNQVRGQELDIDYDHKRYGGEAAGWVKSAEARKDGLWLTVEWTKRAGQLIKEKAYKYFSPEFADEWKHPKTGAVHKNVLFGGGITNRPFLKDILPLNMSEMFDEHRQQQEGNGMDPKKLRKLLGLPEDATDEQVSTALAAVPDDHVLGPKVTEPPKVDDKTGKTGEGEPEGQPQVIAATEGLSAEVIQLAEKSPAIKALVESVTGLQKVVETQQVALQLSEANNTVKTLSEPVDGRALPPSVQEQLKDIFVSAPKELSEKFAAAIKTLNETGYVELGERGINSPDNQNADVAKRFNDEVQKVIDADKLDYAAATERVASLQPQLYTEYRQATYAFREN